MVSAFQSASNIWHLWGGPNCPPVRANVNTEILRQKTAQIQKHSETKLETLETIELKNTNKEDMKDGKA